MPRAGRLLLAAIVIVPGLLLGSLMMYVAWQHNPRGAFHDVDGIHRGAWLAIGAGWFLELAVPGAVVAAGVWALARWGPGSRGET
jgi:hypothetical protein